MSWKLSIGPINVSDWNWDSENCYITKKTDLNFSSGNGHIMIISKCTDITLRYSLKKRVFWVQSGPCSSIRSKVIEVMLRHVNTKNGMLSELHKISHCHIQNWLQKYFYKTSETNSRHGLTICLKTQPLGASRGL